MKKLVCYLGIVLGLMIFSCKKEEIDKEPLLKSSVSDENFKIQDGIIYFKNVKTFQKIMNDFVNKPESVKQIESKLKASGFYSLKNYYDSFDEKKLMDVFSTKSIPNNLKDYFFIESTGNDLTLKEAVPERFLQLLSNKDREFVIGKDKFQFSGKELLVYRNFETESSIKVEKLKIERNKNDNNLRPSGTKSSKESTYYTWDGNSYRLTVDVITYNVQGFLVQGGGWVYLWAYSEFWANHYKRNLGIYWGKDAGEIQVQGNITRFYPVPNSNVNQLISENLSVPVLYNTNEALDVRFNLKSYNITAYCKGNNGSQYYVSTSGSI